MLQESANCREVANSGSASAVSGLSAYWDSADAAPRPDWEDWWDLFTVAVNALALKNNLNERAADRKVISAFSYRWEQLAERV